METLLIDAGIASIKGSTEIAVAKLRAAADDADIDRCAFYAAVARRRAGQLLGGDEGR